MQGREGQGQGQAALGLGPRVVEAPAHVLLSHAWRWYGDDAIKGIGNGAIGTGEGS